MPRRKGDSFSYFIFLLYPDDKNHMRVKDYIIKNRVLFPEYGMILHDEDEVEEDEIDTITTGLTGARVLKKSHYHVIVKYYTQKSEETFLKLFKGDICKVIGIRDYKDKLLYLLHQNYDAMRDNKHVYDKSKFIGTSEFEKCLDVIQNSNFVQFYDIVKDIVKTPNCSLIEYFNEVNKLPVDERDRILRVLHSQSYMIRSTILDAQRLMKGN